MLREGARPEVVRDNMGHANIDVTQNVYGKSWWEERVDAVTRAVEAVSPASEKAEKANKDQRQSVNNEWVPFWVPQQEARIQVVVSDPLVPIKKSKCFIWCRLGARMPFFLSLSCIELVPNPSIRLP
jgi:hypothetical protein